MQRQGKTEKSNVYKSYEEFCKKAYPSSIKKSSEKIEDPYVYGTKLASESLIKLKRLLAN